MAHLSDLSGFLSLGFLVCFTRCWGHTVHKIHMKSILIFPKRTNTRLNTQDISRSLTQPISGNALGLNRDVSTLAVNPPLYPLAAMIFLIRYANTNYCLHLLANVLPSIKIIGCSQKRCHTKKLLVITLALADSPEVCIKDAYLSSNIHLLLSK